MQKLFNAMALLSFAVSASVTGVAVYAYMNRDAIKEMVTTAITDSLPIPDIEVPEIPGANSVDIPAPTIPGL